MTTTHLSLPAEAPETYEELVRLYPPIVVVLERPEGSANCANFGWVGLDSRAGRDYCPDSTLFVSSVASVRGFFFLIL